MDRILVTGGAGFIGSHLCEELVKTCEVHSLDNYFSGSENNHVNGVNYIKGDTKDISELIDFDPDIIFHLGEYSRVERSFEDIENVFELNSIGTFKVLEFARNTGAKIIYSGSSTKFGDGGLGKNASPYAWSKFVNSELVKNYASWFGVNYAITYFYNVYGNREISTGPYATLVGIFKTKMKNNEPLTVVSPGSQIRNFTHVDDIINGLILVAKYGSGDEYGIGSKESFSVLEIAQFFGGEIQYLPERKGNRMESDVLTKKIRSLGWQEKNSIVNYINKLRADNWQQID